MQNEPSTQDILDAINGFASHVDERFEKIESMMVTKDYLDEKLGDLRGDLVVLIRKEDRKLGALIEELLKRNILDQATATRILSLEPFGN